MDRRRRAACTQAQHTTISNHGVLVCFWEYQQLAWHFAEARSFCFFMLNNWSVSAGMCSLFKRTASFPDRFSASPCFERMGNMSHKRADSIPQPASHRIWGPCNGPYAMVRNFRVTRQGVNDALKGEIA